MGKKRLLSEAGKESFSLHGAVVESIADGTSETDRRRLDRNVADGRKKRKKEQRRPRREIQFGALARLLTRSPI